MKDINYYIQKVDSMDLQHKYSSDEKEYVAEYLGVSRQAVSKWERGESDPNMSNLIAMAKLYGVAVEGILKQVS